MCANSDSRQSSMATRAPKKARKVPPCATPIDPAKDVTLPVVKSYALDIPTDPAELAQFDRSVSSIFYRITGRAATKTTKRKRVDASADKENVDPQEVVALEENDDQQEGESKGYLSENSPGRSELNDDDRDQEAFFQWQYNCECPKGTTRWNCSCERVPAYFAWVDNCTCHTNEMGRCTCGACAPQFKFAKRLQPPAF
jgi:hypothetical protein